MILIVGENFPSLAERLKTSGHSYVTLQDVRSAHSASGNVPPYVPCDFTDRAAVLAAVDTLQQPITAAIALYENYVVPAAWINQHLGLPGMSPATALACTDKSSMRQAFAAAPEPISPEYAVVESEQDVVDFARHHQFPLILKPANLVKSLLVTRSDSLQELLANYRQTSHAIASTYQRYAPDRQPRIIIEKFLAGPLFSVAAFAGRHGEVHTVAEPVDLETAHQAGYQDNFLYCRRLPSALNAEQQAQLRHCAQLGVKALGMRSSPAHVELVLTAQGPRIIEIGARNGGYRERMYRMANGIDIIQATIDTALGKTPQLAATKHEACAVLELFPKSDGLFQAIRNGDSAAQLPTCTYFRVKAEPGQRVGKAAEGYKCCAIVILQSRDQAALEVDLAYIRSHVDIETEPLA